MQRGMHEHFYNARTATQEANYLREKTYEQVTSEFPAWGADRIEREVARLVEHGEAIGEAKGRAAQAADSIIAAGEREPGVEPDEHGPASIIRPLGTVPGDDESIPFRHGQPGAAGVSPVSPDGPGLAPGRIVRRGAVSHNSAVPAPCAHACNSARSAGPFRPTPRARQPLWRPVLLRHRTPGGAVALHGLPFRKVLAGVPVLLYSAVFATYA
jgi:hypothetical protein